jgi:hypothetical protein
MEASVETSVPVTVLASIPHVLISNVDPGTPEVLPEICRVSQSLEAHVTSFFKISANSSFRSHSTLPTPYRCLHLGREGGTGFGWRSPKCGELLPDYTALFIATAIINPPSYTGPNSEHRSLCDVQVEYESTSVLAHFPHF